MRILFRLVWKNMLDKKLRLLLIIFSLTMSVALFFVANGAATTTRQISLELKKKYAGTADIIVEPNSKTPPFLRTEPASRYASELEYAVGVVEGAGLYRPERTENVRVSLRGVDLDAMQQLSPVVMAAEQNLRPFAGPKIVVGQPTAEKYHLTLGDTLPIEINGVQERFIISGIAEPRGLFLDDGESLFMMVPRDRMAAIDNAGQSVTGLFVRVKDRTRVSAVLGQLADTYGDYTVREAISAAEVERDARERTDPYKLIVVVLLFMGIYVIYSSFRVIAAERLPVVGTLRSVGATRVATSFILLGESLTCGVIGGVLGCVAGIGLLHLMLLVTLPSNLKNIGATVHYSFLQLLATFALAVGVSLVSSLVPILQTAALPIKSTIFGTVEQVSERSTWKVLLGFALLLAAAVAPRVAPRSVALLVDLVSVILPIVAAVLVAPYLTDLFVRVLASLYQYVFGNIGTLAAKNLRENSSILSNISLLIISISSFLVINTLNYSVVTEARDLFRNNALFDVSVWVQGEDRDAERLIYKTPGVTGVLRTAVTSGVEIVGTGSRLETVHGAQTTEFLDYWGIRLLDNANAAEAMRQLDNGRNILVTNLMRDKLGVQKGDTITLKMPRGPAVYTVIGFLQSYNSGGSYGIISERYLKVDTQGQYWSQIGVKAMGDAEAVAAGLKRQFVDRSLIITTVDQEERTNYEQYQSLFDMLKAFSVLTLLISLFGVVNNLLISFLQRKRSLAVLRSIGMSRRQIVSMILIESFSGGLVGSLAGSLGGLLMISVLPFFMVAIEQVSPVHLSGSILVSCLLAGVVISMAASISPALKSSRLNIIESIKYE